MRAIHEAEDMRVSLSTSAKVALAILALPFAVIAGLLSRLFGLRSKLSAAEVASHLREFIDGDGGGGWDWDDFTSVPIANPQLENIRLRADAVALPLTPEGLATLRKLLVEAEQMERSEAATDRSISSAG
jgi:hypothetical protein